MVETVPLSPKRPFILEADGSVRPYGSVAEAIAAAEAELDREDAIMAAVRAVARGG